MPESTLIRNAFNGGEVSPHLEGRSDMAVHRAGSRGIHNMVAAPQGGLARRPGTRYVADVADHTQESWLLPFVSSTADAYILEFTDYKVRFFRAESKLLYSDISFRQVDVNLVASQFEVDGHGFYHGQKIKLKSATVVPGGIGVGGIYYVVLPQAVRVISQTGGSGLYTSEGNHNLAIEMGPYRVYHDVDNDMPSFGVRYFVEETAAANTFKLETEKGAGTPPAPTVAATGPIALVPYPEARRNSFRLATDPKDLFGSLVTISSAGAGVFSTPEDEAVELVTPWTVAEAKELQITQSADTMFLFHRSHPPMELLRINTAAFILQRIQFFDGPYGAVTPLGKGATMDVGVLNVLDGEVARIDCSVAFWEGFHAGTPLRMRRRDFISGTSTDDHALHWGAGIVERIEGHNACFLSPRVGYFDSPGGGTTLSIPSHGFTAGEIVWVRKGDGALPAELSERTPYYVLVAGADAVELESTVGGGAITFSTSTGTSHRLISGWLRSVNESTGASLAHGLVDGTDWCGLWSLGYLPLGLYVGEPYRIVEIDSTTLKLTDRADADVPILDPGSGKFWVNAAPSVGTKQARVRWEFIRPLGADGTSDYEKVYGWRIGAWDAEKGWPGAGAFFEQRLIVGGSDSEPNRVWGSQSSDLVNFGPDQQTGTETKPSSVARTVTDASSFSYQLVGSGKVDLIRWIMPTTMLLAATHSGVFQLRASTNREAITPSNLNADIVSRDGAAGVMPVVSNSEILYLGFTNTRVLAAAFDSTRDAFNPESITGHANHVVTRSNALVQMAYQNDPWGVLWAAREDKKLVGCTFSRNQSLAAWHHHEIGGSTDDSDWGEVESVAVIPSQVPRYDQLWMVVRRKINGQHVRYVEFMSSRFDLGEDAEDAFFVDSGPAPYDGAATLTLSGLGHLVGETVDVWGDAAIQPQVVVSGSGTVTLAEEVSKAAVGLPYSYGFETLPLAAMMDQVETIQGHVQRIVDAFIYVVRSLGGAVSTQNLPHPTAAQIDDDFEPLEYRTPTHPMDSGIPLFTGRIDLMPALAWVDRESVVSLRGEGPAPFHISHLVARIEHSAR